MPIATLVTPNLHEAAAITGRPVASLAQMEEAARAMIGMGAKAVLIKGGHLEGAAIDLLFDGKEFHTYPGPRIETAHTHGTGCTYSAAITALMARGLSLTDALPRAKHYITEAIRSNPGLGHGQGPVNHFAN